MRRAVNIILTKRVYNILHNYRELRGKLFEEGELGTSSKDV